MGEDRLSSLELIDNHHEFEVNTEKSYRGIQEKE